MATKSFDTDVFSPGGQFIDGETVHVAPFSVADFTRASFRIAVEFTKKALAGTGNTFIELQQLHNGVTVSSFASGNVRLKAAEVAPTDLSGYASGDIVCLVPIAFEVPIWTTPNYHVRVHAYHTGDDDEVRVSGQATYIDD